MITPIIPENLFEVNDSYEFVSFEDGVLVIDNWYKNYEEIYDVLQNMYVSRWKWNENGKNFVDYYDCRPVIKNNFPGQIYGNYIQKITYLIQKYF